MQSNFNKSNLISKEEAFFNKINKYIEEYPSLAEDIKIQASLQSFI